MADENKIQFDVELNEGSVESSFKAVDERAVKSAKESAAVFGEAFQRQEQELKASIERIVGGTRKVAEKSAKESAEVFSDMFRKQDEIYKASVKNSIDQAIAKITGSDTIKKSAKESAAVFEDAFEKGLIKSDQGIWDKFFPSDGLQVRGLADLAGGFFLLKQAADLAGSAVNAALNFIIKGEQEIKLDRRFEALATQAGVVADVFKGELTRATQGLIDQTQLLELASQSFIQIGNNAKALPDILQLARKSYATFGGDIVENSQKISQAIASGQTRQLRSIGIFIENDKVLKEYARSIGTVVPLLTEQQQQTARLNAILEKGNEVFRNVKADAAGAEEAFKRLSTATTELFDALSIKVAQQNSGLFASIADFATQAVNKFTKSITADPIDRAKERIGELQERLKQLESQAVTSYSAYGRGSEAFFAKRTQEIEKLRSEIAKYQAQVSDASKEQDKLNKQNEEAAKRNVASAGGGPDTMSDEYIRRRQDLTLKIQELNNTLRASEVQLAQEEFNRKKNAGNLDALYYQQKLQAQDQYSQQSAALEKFYSENGVNDEMLRQQGRETLESEHLNRMLQLQKNYEAQKAQVFYEGETQAISVAESFNQIMEGMDAQAKELSVSASKNFKNLGRSMLQSVGQAAGNAFAAFGQAVAEGENALEAFGKSLLNSLGQMAIQMGTQFILQGIAYTYAGLANGPPLIAAGAALAAFGGILAASGGAGPKDVSGGGGTAGGGIGAVSDINNPINDVIAPEDTLPQGPQTAVNLTINGNVLDRRETGLEIAKILEEQFSDQGLVIRGA